MKKQSGGTARMNISLSQALKRQMDQVEENVNWSGLAARAFVEKLAELASQKQEKTMEDVIQRLRVSRLKLEEADYHAGKAAGLNWAKNDAEAQDLIALEKLSGRLGGDWCAFFTTNHGDAFSAAELFVKEILDEEYGLPAEADEFWSSVIDDNWERVATDDWVRGFADGALNLWHEVQDSL